MEREIKVLGVAPDEVVRTLESLGAVKVFDGLRTITHFDTPERRYAAMGTRIKVTEEGSLKLTVTSDADSPESSELKTRVDQAIFPVLAQLGLRPIARVTARRVSYELGNVDFDLDFFPEVPPFLEIDLEHVQDTSALLASLRLSDAESLEAGTPEIFGHYGKDYFGLFKL